MKLNLISVDFTKSPERYSSIIEDLAMDRSKRAMLKIKREEGLSSISFNTCDRAEVYILGEAKPERVLRSLSLSPILSKCDMSFLSNEDAIRHLFLLSTGLISPLYGEEAIISQLKRASALSSRAGTSSPELRKLFNMALAFGRRVLSMGLSSELDQERVDIAFSYLNKYKSILIIGSSREARELSSRLIKAGREVYMTLRDTKKDFLSYPGVHIIGYEERLEKASKADAVISLSKSVYKTIEGKDKDYFSGKCVLDFSYPNDVDSSLSAISPEELGYTGKTRKRALEIVEPLLEEEIKAFFKWEESAISENSLPMDAKRLSENVIFRLGSKIEALSIPEEDKKGLYSLIGDSVERSYIALERSRRK